MAVGAGASSRALGPSPAPAGPTVPSEKDGTGTHSQGTGGPVPLTELQTQKRMPPLPDSGSAQGPQLQGLCSPGPPAWRASPTAALSQVLHGLQAHSGHFLRDLLASLCRRGAIPPHSMSSSFPAFTLMCDCLALGLGGLASVDPKGPQFWWELGLLC